jgi:asparagine synthase (glutamine-hydrolysing)
VSGIAGILDRAGTDAAHEWLRQATEFMRFRGPDDQQTWWDRYAGFGHAQLRSTDDAECERQPLSLDGRVWIVADVRLDGRADLIRELQSRGRPVSREAPDVELLLHAYHLWGDACLEHLMGDFAFAIWDAREERLFCARDQFGVVPFYYTPLPDGLLFSNTLNCLRLHPDVSPALNDRAVADFLLFNMNMDPATTTFSAIQRLPPASALSWQQGKLRVWRYWQMPEWEGYLRYKRAEDYVEEFRHLFTQAIADRLRVRHLSTHLSGGLDSTSIAATAHRLLVEGGAPFDLRAFTISFQHLISDQEGGHARQVAEAIGIPTEYLVADQYLEAEPPECPPYVPPEPSIDPSTTPDYDLLQRAAAHGRVLLNGLGGDPALMFVPSYWIEWLREGQFRRLLEAQWHYMRLYHRRPPLYFRAGLRHWRRSSERPSLPRWLDLDFAAEFGLQARQEDVTVASRGRIDRRGMSTDPTWANFFAMADPGFSSLPVKVRFPFFDLRLVRFLQAVPPVPWFVRKKLLRDAMQGVLPEPVRTRPKTSLAGDPYQTLARQQGWGPHLIQLAMTAPDLDRYMNRDRLAAALQSLAEADDHTRWLVRTSLALASWLRHRDGRQPGRELAIAGIGAKTPSWQVRNPGVGTR